MRISRALIAASLLTLALVAAEAKKPPKQAAPPAGKANVLDLRGEVFFCGQEGCILPIRGSLIGCFPDGCKAVTDIIVSTGAVTRFVPQAK